MTIDAGWDNDEPSVDRPPVRRAPAGHGQILRAVLAALNTHPAVVWVGQFNSGEFTVEETDRLGRKSRRRVRCNTIISEDEKEIACPDILGMLCDGRLFAVEVKRAKTSSGEFRPGQVEFLDLVRANGGVAFVARGVADAEENL